MNKILIDEATVKLALEALKELVAQTEIGLFAVRHDHVAMQDARQAITALREALAEQPAQQESDAVHQFRSPHCSDWYDGVPDHHDGHGPYEVRTLYTSPQPTQRTWVGLTDEEIESLDCVYLNWLDYEQVEIKGDKEFARAIEARLKELNT